jgi:hypothetical protein
MDLGGNTMQAQAPLIPSIEQQAYQTRLTLETKARNGVNWFFWIAGLSMINTIVYLAGGNLTFIVGLGATQFVDGITTGLIQEIGSGSTTILRLAALAIDIGLTGIFVVAGLLGRRKYRWALISGMILYVLDAGLFIWVGDILGIAFHALALWGLWGGLRAMNALKKLAISQPATEAPTPIVQEMSLFRSDIFRILAGSLGVYLGILAILAIIGYILSR